MEQYTQIPNFVTYGIDKMGNVMDFRSGTIKKSFLDVNGYKRIQLTNPQGTKTMSVARLVALTYIPNENELPQIDHIDRDRLNNCVENLRWVDVIQQLENRIGWGKHKKYIYFEKGTSKKNPYSSWVLQIKNSKLKLKKRFSSDKFTLQDVIEYRNNMLKEHDILIVD